MKKAEQEKINATILSEIDKINAEIDESCEFVSRLRYCRAWIYETENYYILRSYSTNIAAIDRRTNTCYDFLRYVFDFTSTSCQHIAKFRHDYMRGAYNDRKYLTYYPC